MSSSRRPARIALVLLAALSVQLAVPLLTRAANYEVYSLRGYEVWFTQTVGTFVGLGNSSSNELSGWFTRIEHTPAVSPAGLITGGTATLIRTDGVRMDGTFSAGTVTQTIDGAGCTNESHDVYGSVYGLTSSDRPGQIGVGHFQATLIHYRVWAFNGCYSYSASVDGTFTVAF